MNSSRELTRQHFGIIAASVGETASPEDVASIVAHSNEHLLLFHGIKRAGCINAIQESGIRPLTPEGGPGSFWATGSAIFCSEEPTNGDAIWGYDTPFFHYSRSSTESRQYKMAFAVTDAGRLTIARTVSHNKIRPDSQCVIKETVPSEALTLIIVDQVPHQPIQETALDFMARCAEAGMLLRSGVLHSSDSGLSHWG